MDRCFQEQRRPGLTADIVHPTEPFRAMKKLVRAFWNPKRVCRKAVHLRAEMPRTDLMVCINWKFPRQVQFSNTQQNSGVNSSSSARSVFSCAGSVLSNPKENEVAAAVSKLVLIGVCDWLSPKVLRIWCQAFSWHVGPCPGIELAGCTVYRPTVAIYW